jgi:hypothetical protein
VFANNVASKIVGFTPVSGVGGAIANDNSSPSITNSTFYKNNSIFFGGAIYNLEESNPVIENSVFWENFKPSPSFPFGPNPLSSGADIENGPGAKTIVEFSSLQLDSSTYATTSFFDSLGVNNLFATDPLFLSTSDLNGADDIWGTTDDGLKIGTYALIDIGSKEFNTLSLDIAGGQRIINQLIDLGAYENDLSNQGIVCGVQCLDQITLQAVTDDILSGTQDIEASNVDGTISASNIINAGAMMTLRSQVIELKANFAANTGAILLIEVGGCNED